MTLMDQLRSLDRKVSRHDPTALTIAPPAWTPGDGHLRPVQLNQSQRTALWATCAASATVAGIVCAESDLPALLLLPVLFLALLTLSARSGRRRRVPPAALRWLPPGTPLAPARVLSLWLIAPVIIPLPLLTVSRTHDAGGFVNLIGYLMFIPIAENSGRRRWAAVEAMHGGQVVRLARRRNRKRGTSQLYFLPGPMPTATAAAPAGSQDRSNAYRAPAR